MNRPGPVGVGFGVGLGVASGATIYLLGGTDGNLGDHNRGETDAFVASMDASTCW